LLGELGAGCLTYTEVGATIEGPLPMGYRHDHRSDLLGHGDAVFERAVLGLKTWKTHRGPGVRVLPEEAPVTAGSTVLVTLGLPFLALVAPCRVVAVVDEPDRWGFAYGTLAGHPEQGEEAFIVNRRNDGRVLFEITAFSRPADRLVKLSGPLGRGLQRAGTSGYVRSLKRYAAHAI
jgi:uncharacterized protein (UPF0548 family)